MLKYLLTIAFLSVQLAFSQEVKVQNIIQNFEGKTQTQWAIPLSKKEKINISWHERKSSFSEKEGIRTFVGYVDNQMIGVISLYKNQIFGDFSWEGKNYQIFTQNGKIQVKEDKTQSSCGTCENGTCSAEEHSHENPLSISALKKLPLNIDPNQFQDIPEIFSDGILRIYRMAILVDYSGFVRWFGSDVMRVKQHFAQVETLMNEIYMRDIGVKFVVLNDDKLIRISQEQEIFKLSDRNWVGGGSFITRMGTPKINDLIGSENYDVGATICVSGSQYDGLAEVGQAHIQERKASVWVKNGVNTLAHEMGHLFGSMHTFSRGGILTMKTEPDLGVSLMGYGDRSKRDFFSLPSIDAIRRFMLINAPGYFTDRQHTKKVGQHRPKGNAVFGIDTKNKPPQIDRSKVKNQYILPQETYFQFDIKAKDPDGNALWYMAHQADMVETDNAPSKAAFLSRKPSRNSLISFVPEYEFRGMGTSQIPYSSVYQNTRGEFTFWLGVSDGDNSTQNIQEQKHATQYDMVQTKVKIQDGIPFKITEGIFGGINAPIYSAGQKILLKWGVDKNIFGENSKVKISLSNDFGKTYKYVILAETPNDGQEEITLPNIEIGKIRHNENVNTSAGILKIEVLDHIAVALTENNPSFGGFEIKKSQILLENLPSEQNISVKGNQLPDIPNVTAKSSCLSDKNPKVDFEEKINGNIVERIWKSKDLCGNSAFFSQFITKEKEVVPMVFVNPPQDSQFTCLSEIPTLENLEVTGGTQPKVSVVQTRTKMNSNGSGVIIKRTWTATDPDAESISHSQTILVYDNVAPTLSAYPESKFIKSWSEMPPLTTLTAIDNCDGEVQVLTYQGNKPNDEQGRERSYYSWFAKDNSGNEIYHEQIFTLDPNYTPEPPKIQPIEWVVSSLPKDNTYKCKANVPEASTQDLKVTGGAGKPIFKVTERTENETCTNKFTIKRTFTASENGKELMYIQTIVVNDDEKPVFQGTLPQDTEIEEGKSLPEQAELTAKDNCSTLVEVKKSVQDEEKNGKLVKRIYKWVAKDDCGNEVVYQQVITIKEKSVTLTPPTDTPKPPVEVPPTTPVLPNPPNEINQTLTIYNGVSLEEGSENYFRLEGTATTSPISVEIFNELGQKVFQSTNYGQKGEVFRGYPNVKGVFNPSKRLPTGTYFYILKYENVNKSGYLFVR